MIDWVWTVLEELRRTFRLADAVDIAVIATLLYAGLVWYRAAESRRIVVGLSLLAVFYSVARVLDLYLTLLVFHASFAVLLIVLVVVFQEDLRRMLDRLAGWGSFADLRRSEVGHSEADTLAEAVFHLARQHIGALIVVQGRESLERHLDGGIALKGIVSKPLLYSIFDPSSPGHDGAVVLNRNRIELFSAHLPISKNQAMIRGRGTRHSAAIGLSEVSDALVLVVSEERGVVSVAEQNTLDECTGVADLKSRLDTFYQRHFPKKSPTALRQFLLQHWHLKVVALTLAILSWFVLAYNPSTIQRTFVAGIEYRNVPAGWIIDEWAPTEARITLSGSERDFRFFDPAALKVALDLSNLPPGMQEVAVTDKSVRVPQNLAIYRIEPRVVRLILRASQS